MSISSFSLCAAALEVEILFFRENDRIDLTLYQVTGSVLGETGLPPKSSHPTGLRV